MAKKLGDQWCLAMDYWNWCYGYGMGRFRGSLVMEQTCTVEIDHQREEGSVNGLYRVWKGHLYDKIKSVYGGRYRWNLIAFWVTESAYIVLL